MERSRLGAIVAGVGVAALFVGWLGVTVATERTPEDAVEEYLSRVADKDVEGALELVTRSGHGVPYGDSAAFLTPEAISDDWWVVSVAEVDREYGSEATVEAVIAGPGGTAKGEFVTREIDGDWLLSDPFAQVEFPASPLSYLQVNDEILEPADGAGRTYALLPGLYRFYQSVPDVVETRKTEPVAAFPAPEHPASSEDRVVVPRELTAAPRVVKELEATVRQRIDECAEFATPTPYGGCPFATDGEIDTRDGKRVTEPWGLTWTVSRYPVVTMADDRSGEHNPGFALRTDEPGKVTLSGSGIDTDKRTTTFTVTCDIDLTGFRGTVGADGGVTLSASPLSHDPTYNTCRRRP